MTLIESMMEECTLLTQTTMADGLGGFVTAWTDGMSFDAVVIKDASTEAIEAEKSEVSELFTVVTAKGKGLAFHDVFRRESDGAIFRITSNQKDSEAPAASTVQIGKATAERWVIPDA